MRRSGYGVAVPFVIAMTVILAALAVFQIALAAGAPWGRFAWGGQHRVLPTNLRIGSIVSVAIYALMAFVAWERAGASSLLPDAVAQVAMWVIVVYFVLGIVMNAFSRSRHERYTMTPIATALAILSLFIAVG